MRLCTFCEGDQKLAAFRINSSIISIKELNKKMGTTFPITLDELIFKGQVKYLRERVSNIKTTGFKTIPLSEAQLCKPYTNPPKIWGIGLNYRDHANDLKAQHPTDEPASFMKPATSIIGPGDTILLPPQSSRVTGEAEIGVIIGEECKNISIEKAPGVILGFTTIIDMTAEDILQRNPRFLTRSKSFDTFFSFGPWIVTPEEIEDVLQLKTTTILNGEKHRSNIAANMAFPPYFLVAFHSRVMTLKPGDIISCGTPGAVVLKPGDRVGCEVAGIGFLENPVASL